MTELEDGCIRCTGICGGLLDKKELAEEDERTRKELAEGVCGVVLCNKCYSELMRTSLKTQANDKDVCTQL